MEFSVCRPSPTNSKVGKMKNDNLHILVEFSERRKINTQKVPIVSGGLSKSNTVNNMKLMILAKIRVICICSSSPHAASVICSVYCVNSP
jgi:hypothetical protein